jgi:hypothetical protein
VILGNNMGYNAADFPTAADVINNTNLVAGEQNRFVAAGRREPVELMKYIVNTDKSWTDMVSGNYTMMNGIMARFLGGTTQGTFVDPANDAEWLPGTLPSARLGGTREHTGVLGTQAWLSRFPTTPTNRNRHRVYIMAKQFLATDVPRSLRPLDDGAAYRADRREPAAVCPYDRPMAAGWRAGTERTAITQPQRRVSTSHCGMLIARPRAERCGRTRVLSNGDNWFRTAKPGCGTPMPADSRWPTALVAGPAVRWIRCLGATTSGTKACSAARR